MTESGGHRFQRVAAASDIPPGECRRVQIEQLEVAVFNIDGDFYAIDDVCSHAYASLSEGFVEDGEIECPLHGGRFDIRTGKATAEPCTVDLRSYPVRREEDAILVGIPIAD